MLSSVFVIDLVKYSCNSKVQDGSLWYIFYDKQRKIWPMYLPSNGTDFNYVVKPVIKKKQSEEYHERCCERGQCFCSTTFHLQSNKLLYKYR